VVCANPLWWRFFTYRTARLSGLGQRWFSAPSAAMIGLFFCLTDQVLWHTIVLSVTTDPCPFFVCDVHQFAMVLAFCPAVHERPRVVT
jgi:hypothetical protein